MKSLPPEVTLRIEPIQRRHEPVPTGGTKGYQKYRNCLRWDFDFTCPFCLLHDTDFSRVGLVDGTGQTGVEHVTPRSHGEELRNEYRNCVYCCGLCNRARSNKPLVRQRDGASILNPESVGWADHFILADDRVISREADVAAEYTVTAYDVNAPSKVALRRERRETLSEAYDVLSHASSMIARLNTAAESCRDRPEVMCELLQAARELSLRRRQARRDVESYPLVPVDAPTECRCETPPVASVSDWAISHAIEIDGDGQRTQWPEAAAPQPR